MSDHFMALFLQALALVESGNDPRAIGAAGERGAFQMMPAVVASSGGYSERDAARHVRLLERELQHAQIEPTPFHLALAWNAGLGAVQRGAAPVRAYRHAARVENVFNSLSRALSPAEIGPQCYQCVDSPTQSQRGDRSPAAGVGPSTFSWPGDRRNAAARETLSRGGSSAGAPSLGSARADGLPRRSFTLPPASRSASAGVEPAPARGGAPASRAPSVHQGQPARRPQANLAGIVFSP